MGFSFENLNRIELSKNDNVNNVINSFLALLTVLAVHDTMEGLIVRGVHKLSVRAVEHMLIMRSQGSISKMWGHISGYKLFRGIFHPPHCQCTLAQKEDTTHCSLSRKRRPVHYHALLLTTVLRVLIIAIEVAAIFLAINQGKQKMLTDPVVGLTLMSNNAEGTYALSNPDFIGCKDMLEKPQGYDESSSYVNRITRLIACVRLHRPQEFASLNAKHMPVPNGFLPFFLFIDLSGNKVTFSNANKSSLGAEYYAYWTNSQKGPVEGVVPTLEAGFNFSATREEAMNGESREQWMRQLDSYLKKEFGNTVYRTAYDEKAKWAEVEDHPVPVFTGYFQLDNLPKSYQKDKEKRVGQLLQKIVGLRQKRGGHGILHSTVTSIEETEALVEYYIISPVLGSVPWIILLSLVLLFRVAVGKIYPNNFYELVSEVVFHVAYQRRELELDAKTYRSWKRDLVHDAESYQKTSTTSDADCSMV